MTGILATWTERFHQDLEPTPGRWNSALRIVLASAITLLLVMTLRMPFAGLSDPNDVDDVIAYLKDYK